MAISGRVTTACTTRIGDSRAQTPNHDYHQDVAVAAAFPTAAAGAAQVGEEHRQRLIPSRIVAVYGRRYPRRARPPQSSITTASRHGTVER